MTLEEVDAKYRENWLDGERVNKVFRHYNSEAKNVTPERHAFISCYNDGRREMLGTRWMRKCPGSLARSLTLMLTLNHDPESILDCLGFDGRGGGQAGW